MVDYSAPVDNQILVNKTESRSLSSRPTSTDQSIPDSHPSFPGQESPQNRHALDEGHIQYLGPPVLQHNSARALHASQEDDYQIPDSYANLDELSTPPVQNPDENAIYVHESLEDRRNKAKEYKDQERERSRRDSIAGREELEGRKDIEPEPHKISKFATQLYVISYLILFSFLGTLARLGLQAITFYPGAPVVFSELWANFGGSLVFGFLSEDRMLFKEEWGVSTYHREIEKAKQLANDTESGQKAGLQAAKKAHAATKKTIPLYIGLATGFCGSFTSFSSFVRDVFLALSNDLPTPLTHPHDYSPIFATTTSTVSRNGGYSFMALLAIIVTTVSLCISALYIGAHIAIAFESLTPSLPYRFCRKVLDRVAVFLAWGCWIGAIFLARFPPDQNDGPREEWRGRAVFALVFAPLGCLGRFYAALYLNGKTASFPLGTFFNQTYLSIITDSNNNALIYSPQPSYGIDEPCLPTPMGSFTLIHGDHEAILVDAPIATLGSNQLADWIATTIPGKNLTHIYVTHGHGDHFFGIPVLQQRFPGLKAVATKRTVAHIQEQIAPAFFNSFWGAFFPGQIPVQDEIVQALGEKEEILLEGHVLRVVEVGQSDTYNTTVLHVPDLDLVVTGDAVYGECYQYLQESNTTTLRDEWIAAIDEIESLKPKWVVPSHKQSWDGFGADHLEKTKDFLTVWGREVAVAKDVADLERRITELYPQRIGDFILGLSAGAAFPA
ncbi:hypothetical protein B7494_g1444 [Chlorociboria aeruginascens]|nr:hypothetical protein B7494_g1444 [Chlorociboria aeruginascens]